MIDYKTAKRSDLKAEFKRLLRVTCGDGQLPYQGTKKEFFHLPKVLGEGERPLAIVSGMMENSTWLMTLTNHRIILLDKGLIFGLKQKDLALSEIKGINGSTAIMFGTISIMSGVNLEIKRVDKRCVIPFVNKVNEARGIHLKNESESENKPENSPLDHIERLANLKEKGLLTDEEFSAAKNKILNC